jgi:hypothetical protein
MKYQDATATLFTAAVRIVVSVVVVFITLSQAAAEIWGVKTQAPFSEPPSTLFRFEADGSAFTVVGDITLEGLPVDVDGLAINAEGTLFAFVPGDASGQMVTIDPFTAAATLIGIVSGREIRGATITEGRLIGIDIFESALVEIDLETGQQVGPEIPLTLDGEPFSISTTTDLAVNRDGIAVLCQGAMELYEVDLTTGAMSLIFADTEPGDDGSQLAGVGLAFPTSQADARLFLYDVNSEDDIFAYELVSPFERTLVYPNIISSYNAGRGDLASYPFEPVAVPEDHGALPEQPRLLPNFPNPFNPHTTIAFSLPKSQHAKISLIAIDGMHIATIADREFNAGTYSLLWDGTTTSGNVLSSGTYIVRLETESGVFARKLTLVR